jgi:hypothetical protein
VSLRAAAVLLLSAAVLLYVGLAAPLRTRAAAAEEDRRRVQEQSARAEARLVALERRMGALSAAGAASDPGTLRRSVVASLEGVPVTAVRIAVHPARPSAPAAVTLSAEGSFADLVALSGRVVRPGSGIVLTRIRLAPRTLALRMDLEALGLGAQP